MALLTVARRVARTHRLQLSFSLLLLPASAHSMLSISCKVSSLSLAFHQTFSVHCRTPSIRHRFFYLRSLSTKAINDLLEFTEPEIEERNPQEVALLDLLKQVAHFDSETEAMASLFESGIKLNQYLVYSVVWTMRAQWRLAFLVFKWGEKCGCSDKQACDLMVWVLGNHREFNNAWCLIRDMYRSSMDTRRAMLIMIDRYASANDPSKAIRTFHAMEKVKLGPDEEAFYTLLSALCNHGNIEEAEEFMLANRKLFPLNVEGFNIILNGWCNTYVDKFEAKRVWREMSKCCITPNGTSYTHMISCFSKVGNLFDSLRLYDEMKKRGFVPPIEVYHSLIFVLTRENCFDEALKILEKMKGSGLQPDSVTYDSMIRPLCEAKELERARNILATMVAENLSPTIETYHAFLEGVGLEETFEVLNRMKSAGLGPSRDTFLLVLAKFFKILQPENALKIWAEMKHFDVVADPAHYSVLVQGLATCGWLIEAREFYSEMRSNGFMEDPKLQKLLKDPMWGNSDKVEQKVRQIKRSVTPRKGRSLRRKKRQLQSKKKKGSNEKSI